MMIKNVISFIIFMGLFFSSCKSIPEGAVAVKPFEIDKYLGIARKLGFETEKLIWVEHK
jgi:lipocalin